MLKTLEADHPPAEKLLSTTQAELDALARFMTDKRIVTIPKAAPARVEETPPFLRAITTASMDIPGPFETVATEAYYNMTLPDPKASAAEKNEFMTQWYYPAITNVSVHEVWPGHYLQFLYARNFPSDVRKVFGAATNSEGWAHYCEQMVIDEGFHADDPRYRLAQLQDALLRDARFIVGIRLHTKGMTIAGGGSLLHQGRLPVAARRAVGNEARHIGSDVRLLHDGEADDSEAPRRLQGEDGRAILAAGFPRLVHQARPAAVAARAQVDARRNRPLVLRSMEKVNLAEKLSQINTHWRPKVVGELNGQEVKLVKFKGEFVWHHHEREDELFLVVRGSFRVEFRDKVVSLGEGELIIVPRGVEHRTVADDEAEVLIFEPAATRNTGNVEHETLTAPTGDRL